MRVAEYVVRDVKDNDLCVLIGGAVEVAKYLRQKMYLIEKSVELEEYDYELI